MCFLELLYSNTLLIFKQYDTKQSAVVLNVITSAMRSSHQCICAYGMPLAQSNAWSDQIQIIITYLLQFLVCKGFKDTEICFLHEEE